MLLITGAREERVREQAGTGWGPAAKE